MSADAGTVDGMAPDIALNGAATEFEMFATFLCDSKIRWGILQREGRATRGMQYRSIVQLLLRAVQQGIVALPKSLKTHTPLPDLARGSF